MADFVRKTWKHNGWIWLFSSVGTPSLRFFCNKFVGFSVSVHSHCCVEWNCLVVRWWFVLWKFAWGKPQDQRTPGETMAYVFGPPQLASFWQSLSWWGSWVWRGIFTSAELHWKQERLPASRPRSHPCHRKQLWFCGVLPGVEGSGVFNDNDDNNDCSVTQTRGTAFRRAAQNQDGTKGQKSQQQLFFFFFAATKRCLSLIFVEIQDGTKYNKNFCGNKVYLYFCWRKNNRKELLIKLLTIGQLVIK